MLEQAVRQDAQVDARPSTLIDEDEVIRLNVEDLDVQELEHRLELATTVASGPCVVLYHWES